LIRQEGYHAIVKSLKNGEQKKIWNNELEEVACSQFK